MKTILLSAAAFSMFALVAFTPGKPHVDVYTVDTKTSTLQWFAEKVTGKHNGTIMLSSGEIRDNHGQMSGTFEIDMTTIEDKDIEAGATRTKLENHLKSPDFFDVEKFPKAKFVISSIVPNNEKNHQGNTHIVKGILTIKGISHENTFDVKLTNANGRITCAGEAIVDRSKYDVRYGSKTFFADIGDKMIYDEFRLKFNVVANR